MESHLNSKRRWVTSLILLFTTCFRLYGLKLEKRRATVFQVNLFAIRFNLVQFQPSTLPCSFLVLDLCFSWEWNQYLVVSIYFNTSSGATESVNISWHSPFNFMEWIYKDRTQVEIEKGKYTAVSTSSIKLWIYLFDVVVLQRYQNVKRTCCKSLSYKLEPIVQHYTFAALTGLITAENSPPSFLKTAV